MEYAIFTHDKNADTFKYLAYNGERYVWADKDGYVRAVYAGHNRKETRFMFASKEEAAKVLEMHKNEHVDRCCLVGAAPFVGILSMFYENADGTVYTGRKLRDIYCDIMQKDPEMTSLIDVEDYFVEDVRSMKVITAEKAFVWLFKHGTSPDAVAAVRTMKKCGLKEAFEYVKAKRKGLTEG